MNGIIKIMVFMFFLMPIISTGKNNKEHKQVLVSSDTSYIVAQILIKTNGKRLKTSDNILYTWYQRNRIKSTFGNYSGKLLDGNYILYDLLGNMIVKGHYNEGKRVGKWYLWNRNGALIETQEYSNGLLDGRIIKYDKNGKFLLNTMYKKGLIEGAETVFIDGIKVSEIRYKNNIKNKRYIYEKGKLIRVIKYDEFGDIKKDVLKENSNSRIDTISNVTN